MKSISRGDTNDAHSGGCPPTQRQLRGAFAPTDQRSLQNGAGGHLRGGAGGLQVQLLRSPSRPHQSRAPRESAGESLTRTPWGVCADFSALCH